MELYKSGELVKEENIYTVGDNLEAGGTSSFDVDTPVKPSDIDRYTVSFEILR